LELNGVLTTFEQIMDPSNPYYKDDMIKLELKVTVYTTF